VILTATYQEIPNTNQELSEWLESEALSASASQYICSSSQEAKEVQQKHKQATRTRNLCTKVTIRTNCTWREILRLLFQKILLGEKFEQGFKRGRIAIWNSLHQSTASHQLLHHSYDNLYRLKSDYSSQYLRAAFTSLLCFKCSAELWCTAKWLLDFHTKKRKKWR